MGLLQFGIGTLLLYVCVLLVVLLIIMAFNRWYFGHILRLKDIAEELSVINENLDDIGTSLKEIAHKKEV